MNKRINPDPGGGLSGIILLTLLCSIVAACLYYNLNGGW